MEDDDEDTRLTAIFQETLVSRILLEPWMAEVVATTGAMRYAKLQSNRRHQHTTNQLFTGRMPSFPPNQQCQSAEGKNITVHGLAHSKLTWGSFNPVFNH